MNTTGAPEQRAAVSGAVDDCPVLAEYFDRLDGPRPDGVLALLAPDFRFTTIWGEQGFARPASGGVGELHAYFSSRDAAGQRHHLLHGASFDGGVELAAGYTTRHEKLLASFLVTIRLDGKGRIRRFMSARTTAMSLLDW
jgi:hypothetical protein